MTSLACHGVRTATARALVLAILFRFAAGFKSGHVDLIVEHDGHMMRREAETETVATSQLVRSAKNAEPEAGASEKSDIVTDGPVEVVNPAQSASEKLKLMDQTEACLKDNATSECMEQFGSYGIRKMFTETFENLERLGQLRSGWMSHPEVQKKKLFELTVPGTVNSGSYVISEEDGKEELFGVISQNFDFYQQLEMGIRMFDIRVAYSTQSKQVFISHGALLIPLADALKDIKRFLKEHEREVVFLDVKKDDSANPMHLKPLVEEDNHKTRVPGQLVHEVIQSGFNEMLVNYTTLRKLPDDQLGENPDIAALTDIGARVVYFWNTQQVLCSTFKECKTSPGWRPHKREAGFEFTFGPPFELGKRTDVNGDTSATIIEPSCIARSSSFTMEQEPERLVKKIENYSETLNETVSESRPNCFPSSAPVPEVHTPTLFYSIDGHVTLSHEEDKKQAAQMTGIKAIYTRGEGFTVRTDAERTNYLLLAWYLKKDNRKQYMRPNTIMMEFAGSATMPVIRLVEANQGRPECGFAVYCKDSGSCWADTLLGPLDRCLPEADVLKKLEEHVNGTSIVINKSTMIYLCVSAAAGACVLMCILSSFAVVRKTKKSEGVEGAQGLVADNAETLTSDSDDEVPGLTHQERQ